MYAIVSMSLKMSKTFQLKAVFKLNPAELTLATVAVPAIWQSYGNDTAHIDNTVPATQL